MPKTAATYYVRIDTFWQNSPDRFVGPFPTRAAAQKAIDAACADPQSQIVVLGTSPRDIKHAIRVWGIMTATEARRAGMHEDWDSLRNVLPEIPLHTDHLFEMEQED